MKTAAVQMNMLVIGGGFLQISGEAKRHLAWLGKTEVARLWVNLHRVENLNNRVNGKLNDSLHFARDKEMVKKTQLNILFDFDFKKELQWNERKNILSQFLGDLFPRSDKYFFCHLLLHAS